MKKIFLGILSLYMAISLIACNVNDKNDNSNKIVDKKDEFSFTFLKLENEEKNKIYSPLSIKYALKMLERGAVGKSKEQIFRVIGDIELTKYESNNNMSLANSLFIRDTFKSEIEKTYINALKKEYNAEIIFDSFANPDNVNSWISDKTLKLINNLVDDVSMNDFILINALGIDMKWENHFLAKDFKGKMYQHENFYCEYLDEVTPKKFGKQNEKIAGMEIVAAINNYDIVNELGDDEIRKVVGKKFREWAKTLEMRDWQVNYFDKDLSDENIEKKLKEFLNGSEKLGSKGYIAEIDSNYGKVDFSTQFSLHVDDDIKVFAKDLKEYNGTTLQYVGIMPIKEKLDKYILNINDEKIDNIIANLKDLKSENFKEGVVTKITGYIPKFKFEYELKLKEDLKQLGIVNVFEEGKAELTEICKNDDMFITEAKHKANIEFTEDGIKAAAVTSLIGSLSSVGGGIFDYSFDVPVEEIDLTFDKPYMFLIRDKKTEEIWFVGTVYEPLLWENEPEKDLQGAT